MRTAARSGSGSRECRRCCIGPTAKAILRDAIRATIGCRALTNVTGSEGKSLIRMFGPSGNLRAAQLARVMEALQGHQVMRLEVRAATKEDAA